MPTTKNFQPGDYIFKEGETGICYLLEEGSVEIVKLTPKGLFLVTLKKGHYSERWQSLKGIENAGAKVATCLSKKSTVVIFWLIFRANLK